MDRLAELLRQGVDKLVNFPTEAQRFITNPQAFTQLLTGKNPMPKETGFAAGATGLPAQQGTVLDPDYQAYMQGYEQGEPVGYAGMALPFAAPAAVATAKALAPKAGMMAENYMVKQGMIQPLTAYHGTPHTIQGQFDISKVGTGEGAQAYGHGMYFAENPNVAIQYKNILSKPEFTKTGEGIELRGQLPRMLNESYDELVAKNGIQQTNYGDVTDIVGQRLDRQMKDALKANDMDWYNKTADMKLDLARFRENPPPNVGNLYKVDIPDEYIPNMLDWDLPISQQSAKVQEIAKQLDPNLLADTPHLIVRGQPRHWTEVVDKIEDLQNPKIIKLLKKIYGEASEVMPYGDYLASKMTGEQLYRNLSNPTQWSKEAAPYAMKAGMEDAAVSAKLNKLGVKGIRYKDAMSRGADEGTSNFVVFDPAQVKILEQNSKPVTRKEILEQQINKIE
jgi:hypothetical protein